MFGSPLFWLGVFLLVLLYNFLRASQQNILLLTASYLICATLSLPYLLLLVALTSVAYIVGRLLITSPHRRLLLLVGITVQLAGLLAFKYFFVSLPATSLNIWIPLGISFYTFRLLSYLFDVSAQRLQAVSWLEVATYAAFFPQMVAGPIERAANFIPYLKTTRRLDQTQIVLAATYIFVGIFYKNAIADPLIALTDAGFNDIGRLSSPDALAVLILFSIRLYADFAGYTALAIGTSTLFSLPAMENFRQPYFAQTITDFWNRWHISLSTWFRDYCFYPLSRLLLARFGPQYSVIIQPLCIFAVMLLTGLWHGIMPVFLAWGALHATYLLLERILRQREPLIDALYWQQRLTVLINILVTQMLVTAGWLFFGLKTLDKVTLFIQRLFAPSYEISGLWWPKVLTPIVLIFFIDWVKPHQRVALWHWHPALRITVFIVMMMIIFIMGTSQHGQFIYAGF
jgi:alginate O-acetyltransferase complex protein AlgI